MVEIQCLACGETLQIPQFVNIDNYDGQVLCQKCKSLLHIKLVKGEVHKYKIEKKNAIERPVILNFVPAEQLLQEERDTVKDKED